MSLLAWVIAGLAFAADDAEEATSCLEIELADLWSEGVRARRIESAMLALGETREFSYLLYGGLEYTFRGCAGAGVTNLDLLLVDDAGRIVARETTKSRDPVLVTTPSVTGRYRLVAYVRGIEGTIDRATALPVAVALTFGS